MDATRFMKYVYKAADGCWMWTGAMSSHGYGTCSHNAKTTRAHRMAYTLFCGEIPEGKLVRHTCGVTQCVNPEHLLLGTQKDNLNDIVGGPYPNLIPRPEFKLTYEQANQLLSKLKGA